MSTPSYLRFNDLHCSHNFEMFCKYQYKDIMERSSIVLISLMLYLAAICKCEIKCNVYTEAVTGSVLKEKVFLEISQNSQGNTCARVFF